MPTGDSAAADTNRAAGDSNPKAAAEAQYSGEPLRARQTATVVDDVLIPHLMHQAMAGKSKIDPGMVQAYRDKLIRDMGNSTDPGQKILCEHAAVAHVMALQMHCCMALSKTAEETCMYAGATAKFMAETRLMTLAIPEYRILMAKAKKAEQEVGEQKRGRSTAGAGRNVQTIGEKTDPDTKVGSNKPEKNNGKHRKIARKSVSRSKKPAEAGAADRRRKAKVAAGGAFEPALVQKHGSPNGRW
jgi:hypothetical protein